MLDWPISVVVLRILSFYKNASHHKNVTSLIMRKTLTIKSMQMTKLKNDHCSWPVTNSFLEYSYMNLMVRCCMFHFHSIIRKDDFTHKRGVSGSKYDICF